MVLQTLALQLGVPYAVDVVLTMTLTVMCRGLRARALRWHGCLIRQGSAQPRRPREARARDLRAAGDADGGEGALSSACHA